MRRLMWATILATVTAVVSLAHELEIDARPTLQIDRAHTEWIDGVMRSISTIKPGMTRKELFRVFAEEGGLSTRTQRRYVYRHCPHIKVEVEFSSVEGESEESPADKIVKISRPFLEYSIAD